MKYYLKVGGRFSFLGPYDITQIKHELSSGSITNDYLAIEATGQTERKLKQELNWINIKDIIDQSESVDPQRKLKQEIPAEKEEKMNSSSDSVIGIIISLSISLVYLIFVLGYINLSPQAYGPGAPIARAIAIIIAIIIIPIIYRKVIRWRIRIRN